MASQSAWTARACPCESRGPVHGQHLRRAAVAQSQIRGSRVLWKSGLGMRSDEALSKMEEGPPGSVCRGRFQTDTSCEGKEPWWGGFVEKAERNPSGVAQGDERK